MSLERVSKFLSARPLRTDRVRRDAFTMYVLRCRTTARGVTPSVICRRKDAEVFSVAVSNALFRCGSPSNDRSPDGSDNGSQSGLSSVQRDEDGFELEVDDVRVSPGQFAGSWCGCVLCVPFPDGSCCSGGGSCGRRQISLLVG